MVGDGVGEGEGDSVMVADGLGVGLGEQLSLYVGVDVLVPEPARPGRSSSMQHSQGTFNG